MKLLVRPGTVALLAGALALGIHPRLRPWLGSEDRAAIVVATLALLLTLAYVVRGLRSGLGERLLGLGALALVLGLAQDGARAHRGVMSLDVGQTKNNFEEQGAFGQGLGLRPLGFELHLAGASGSVATLELPPGGVQVTVTSGHAASLAPFRFGDPQLIPTGQAVGITVAVSDGSGTRLAEVRPGEPGSVGDLEITLERYFPDFALDDKQQPFSRSLHSRNPAALLGARRGDRTFRVFVIRSMPGLHQVPELGQSFALGAVQPEVAVRLQVAEEPAAPILGVAALLLLAGALATRSPA